MTIDKHTLDQAKKWAGEILDRARPHQYADTAIAAAEVVRDLPAVIVDGDKVREIIDWRDSKPSGDDYDGEFYERIRALLPTPTPAVEIALGAWAMHPEHGKVLITSTRADSDGWVRVCMENDAYPVGAGDRHVNRSDLSPLPDTQGDSDSDQGSNCQGSLNSFSEPQPGEAWEVAVDDEKFNAIVSGAGYLYVDTVRTWTPAHSVTPLRRLVPAQEPRVLTTVEDYANAKLNTVVSRGEDYTVVEKVGRDHWNSTNGTPSTDDDAMAGTSRTVLWEPEA